MNKTLKNALLFTAAMIPIAAVGGAFTVNYAFQTFEPDVQTLILESVKSYEALVATGTLQAVIFAAVCGFLGYLLSEKTGLMRRLSFTKTPFIRSAAVTAVCGILFSLDYWVFGAMIPQLAKMNELLITPTSFLSAFLYGGIVEEVLLRLFLMSLFSFLIWKIFCRGYEKSQIPPWVYITANVLAAALFAAGHLPATIQSFGSLSPTLVFRCFLLNGGLGITFGYLYRKYGIQYAMLAHAGCHMISKFIWILFV